MYFMNILATWIYWYLICISWIYWQFEYIDISYVDIFNCAAAFHLTSWKHFLFFLLLFLLRCIFFSTGSTVQITLLFNWFVPFTQKTISWVKAFTKLKTCFALIYSYVTIASKNHIKWSKGAVVKTGWICLPKSFEKKKGRKLAKRGASKSVDRIFCTLCIPSSNCSPGLGWVLDGRPILPISFSSSLIFKSIISTWSRVWLVSVLVGL